MTFITARIQPSREGSFRVGRLSDLIQVTWILPVAASLWENWIAEEDIETEAQLYALGTERRWEKAGGLVDIGCPSTLDHG